MTKLKKFSQEELVLLIAKISDETVKANKGMFRSDEDLSAITNTIQLAVHSTIKTLLEFGLLEKTEHTND